MGNIYHEWNGTVLTITSDSGTSSADLKGDKGDIGVRGAQGAPGCLVSPAGATIPAVNESDNGKILQVVDGAWTAVENSGGSKINLGVKNYLALKNSLPNKEDVNGLYEGDMDAVDSELARAAIIAWLADNNTPIFLDEYCTIPATKIQTATDRVWGAYFAYEIYFETVGIMIHVTAVEVDDSGNPVMVDINTAKEIRTYSFALAASATNDIVMLSGSIQSLNSDGSTVNTFAVNISNELNEILKGNIVEVQIFALAMGDIVNALSFPCLIYSSAFPYFNHTKNGVTLDFNNKRVTFTKEAIGENGWNYGAGEYYICFVTK